MSGGGGRAGVKMEAPFYPEEGLELLPDFVPLPGFGAGGPGAEAAAAAHKLLLGAGKKRDLAAASPAPLPGPFALRPAGAGVGARAAAALRLLPAAAPPPGAGPRGGPEAALVAPGAPAELPLLKLPPAADLEQLLIQGAGPASPGPAAAGPFLYRQQVTQEQEGFVDGFVKALADLGSYNPAGPLSPSGGSYPPAPPGLPFSPALAGPGRLPARAPEEPQTVPEVQAPPAEAGGAGTPPPPLSPLDAESQERLKAERKRLRNRIAASKCRRRKLERIARLEEKVKALKGQNAELAATASLLRAQVSQLQGRVRSHLSSGCHINAAAAAPPAEGPAEPAAAAAPETSAC